MAKGKPKAVNLMLASCGYSREGEGVASGASLPGLAAGSAISQLGNLWQDASTFMNRKFFICQMGIMLDSCCEEQKH